MWRCLMCMGWSWSGFVVLLYTILQVHYFFMLKREDSLYQGVVWLRKHGSVLHQLRVSDSEEGAYAPMTHSCAGCITFRNAQDRHAVERDQILWKCIGTLK